MSVLFFNVLARKFWFYFAFISVWIFRLFRILRPVWLVWSFWQFIIILSPLSLLMLLCTHLSRLLLIWRAHLFNHNVLYSVRVCRHTSSRIRPSLVRIVRQLFYNLVCSIVKVVIIRVCVHLLQLSFGPGRKLFSFSGGPQHKSIFDNHVIVCGFLNQASPLHRRLIVVSTLCNSQLWLVVSPLICLIFDLFNWISIEGVLVM